jgi:hypothetical protein
VEVLEGLMEGKQVVITCTLTMNSQKIPKNALVDYRATGISVVNQGFAHRHKIQLQELRNT